MIQNATGKILDFPDLTAAQIGGILGISRQAARERLIKIPPSGARDVSGNPTTTWNYSHLPEPLKTEISSVAQENGYSTVGEFLRGYALPWKPEIPLDEISDDDKNGALKLRTPLLPIMRRVWEGELVSEIERDGFDRFKAGYGEISSSHFRTLINRVLARDRGRGDFDKWTLYLPERIQREQPTAAPAEFPSIMQAILAGPDMDTLHRPVKNSHVEKILRAAFEVRKAMLESGREDVAQVHREIREFIFSKAQSLFPSREAVKKLFNRNLEKFMRGLPFDRRCENKGRNDGDLTKQILALPWFLPAVAFFHTITNRTRDDGSIPEAVRRVISLPNLPAGWSKKIERRFMKSIGLKIIPTCPDDLRTAILGRQNSGCDLLPKKIRSSVPKLSRLALEHHRRPHETELKLQCPGTMMISRKSGVQQFIRAGDVLEADDGSINFPVCIPWTSPAGGLITETPCSAKYGVIVGRFQWLRAIDVATRYRPGWVFVARQRGSYRGADVLTLLDGLTRQHGVWDEYRFERGVFKCKLVCNAIKLIGSDLHTVHSPHAKPFIEGGFNYDWTKLSVHFPQCDLGRHRGDTEEANRVMQKCRAGHADPRRYFPMLADVTKAFDEITQEQNRTLVKSNNSGKWTPEEKWLRETADRELRQVDQDKMMAFAPYAMAWTVRGAIVGGRVPLFEGLSVPFEFTAPWLHEFDGAQLRVHFDATAHKCFAMPVLLQAWHGHSAGEVLGQLQQINETTGYIRMMLGWGVDVGSAGLKAKQQASVAMRREVRTVMPGGKSGYSASEVKTIDSSMAIESGVPQATATESDLRDDSGNRLAKRMTERASRWNEIEAFERENQALFV